MPSGPPTSVNCDQPARTSHPDWPGAFMRRSGRRRDLQPGRWRWCARSAEHCLRPRHLHLPAAGIAEAGRRHLRLLPDRDPAVEHHLHLRLPHGRSRRHARSGDRVHPRQRQGVRPRRAGRRLDVDDFAQRLSFFFVARTTSRCCTPSATTEPPRARPAICAGQATDTGNVQPPIREALALCATGGEIAYALRDVWGVYQPQATL